MAKGMVGHEDRYSKVIRHQKQYIGTPPKTYHSRMFAGAKIIVLLKWSILQKHGLCLKENTKEQKTDH